jgi:uncharacterized protein (TIGR02145 family)
MNPFIEKTGIGLVLIIFWISGCKKTEPEKILAITTDDIEIFAEGIYTLKGTVVSIGNDKITQHGFYWSESANPEINGTLVQLGAVTSAGSFSSTLYGVLPGKTYHVKAFATFSSVPCFGDEKLFTTPDNMRLPIIDADHNIYYSVKIGDQTWMSTNLKVTHYSDGSMITRIEDRLDWFYMPWYNSAYCWYDNFSTIASKYGNLYTWPAAMKINSASEIRTGVVQGVCPDGWHLPSDDEWKQLEMFLGMSQDEANAEKWRGADEGGKMKSDGMRLWKSPNTGATDESAFGALPAGWRDGAGYYVNIETSTKFWSSSIRGDYGWMRQLDYNSSQIFRGTTGVYEGNSVRCIKNQPEVR